MSDVSKKPVSSDHMLTIRITPEFRKQLRHYAAEENVSLSAVVKAALTAYMANSK